MLKNSCIIKFIMSINTGNLSKIISDNNGFILNEISAIIRKLAALVQIKWCNHLKQIYTKMYLDHHKIPG